MLMYMKLPGNIEISLYGSTIEFLRLILVHINYNEIIINPNKGLQPTETVVFEFSRYNFSNVSAGEA